MALTIELKTLLIGPSVDANARPLMNTYECRTEYYDSPDLVPWQPLDGSCLNMPAQRLGNGVVLSGAFGIEGNKVILLKSAKWVEM